MASVEQEKAIVAIEPLVEPGRLYFLSLSRSCSAGCEICENLGCRNETDRSLENIFRVIARASASGNSAVVLPANFLDCKEAIEIVEFCKRKNVGIQLQVHWPVFLERQAEVKTWLKQGVSLCLVFVGNEKIDNKLVEELMRENIESRILIAPKHSHRILDFLRQFSPCVYNVIYFHFSPFKKHNDSFTIKEIFRFIALAKQRFPALTIRPPRGIEIWDPQISSSLSLDSDASPGFSSSCPGSKILISVIIPSFNSATLLKNTIRHLLAQNIGRTSYEIIVVDDGSTDGSEHLVRNFIAPESGAINFKYIYFPRSKARTRGDGNFRAGISRNLGVKFASGQILAFLDSDIIVAENYLADILSKHEQWDVVQSIRLHLKDKNNNETINYESIQKDRDSFVLEEEYWGRFFQTKNWSELEYFWKYTCTYSLSLKKAHFIQAGWFRRTFVYYGFEDTDLGYRLAKMGLRFYLNPMVTFHLNSRQDRSEYHKSDYERYLLLAKTAKIFFLNTLDPIVYEHFKSLMGGELFWSRKQPWLEGKNLPLDHKLRTPVPN